MSIKNKTKKKGKVGYQYTRTGNKISSTNVFYKFLLCEKSSILKKMLTKMTAISTVVIKKVVIRR